MSKMRSVTHYVSRAKSLGAAGIARQIGQRLAETNDRWRENAVCEWKARRRISDQALLSATRNQWPSVTMLLDHLATRPGQSFLLPHNTLLSAADALYHVYDLELAEVFATADRACRGEFELFEQSVSFTGSVDWHRDPRTGYIWPLWVHTALEQPLWAAHRPADLKPVWELNRHQVLVPLAIAWSLSDDARYAERATALLENWIAANPYGRGINWFSSLEIAIRLIAWTTAFQFLRLSADFRAQIGSVFLKSVLEQAEFLHQHLSTWEDVPNNHLIGEAAGLAITGAAFPEFHKATAWRDTGMRVLGEQIAAQTFDDGVNKEQATGYQRFVAEFLLAIVALMRRNLLPTMPALEQALTRMLDFLAHTTAPNGDLALWGDADDGRALGLERGPFADVRWLLAAGAALFERGDWKRTAGSFGLPAFLLLGAPGRAAWDCLDDCTPQRTSRAFESAGVVILRTAWAPDADLMAMRCGPFGLGGEGFCAHAHCDLLSPLLWLAGQPVLIDSGTYLYYGRWRDIFRRTAAHNTLIIDACEQAIPLTDFSWHSTRRAQLIRWSEIEVTGEIEAAPGVWHQRTLHCTKPGNWEIVDTVQGAGQHTLAWRFHLAPALTPRLGEHTGQIIAEAGSARAVHITPPLAVRVDIRPGWCSTRYGVKEPSMTLNGTWVGELPTRPLAFTWRFEHVMAAGREPA